MNREACLDLIAFYRLIGDWKRVDALIEQLAEYDAYEAEENRRYQATPELVTYLDKLRKKQ